jgi:hypothetical protein
MVAFIVKDKAMFAKEDASLQLVSRHLDGSFFSPPLLLLLTAMRFPPNQWLLQPKGNAQRKPTREEQ